MIVIGYLLLGLAIGCVVYFLVYPQLSKQKLVQKSPRLRPKALLFDERLGLCMVEGGEKLSNDSFKLELASEAGTYHQKYYKGEITPYHEYNTLVGSGSPLYITRKALNVMEQKPTTELDTIQGLRDELKTTKARSKIQLNDPDEKVNRIVSWLQQLETSRKTRPEVK